MAVTFDTTLEGIDWEQAKADLAADMLRLLERSPQRVRRPAVVEAIGRGIASTLMRMLADAVPGQHIGLQTDDQQAFYAALGYGRQPEFWSLVSGRWLDNDANR